MAERAPWGLANWGAYDRERYQAELDALMDTEVTMLRRYDEWAAKHGDIVVSNEGAHCAGCGERFDG